MVKAEWGTSSGGHHQLKQGGYHAIVMARTNKDGEYGWFLSLDGAPQGDNIAKGNAKTVDAGKSLALSALWEHHRANSGNQPADTPTPADAGVERLQERAAAAAQTIPAKAGMTAAPAPMMFDPAALSVNPDYQLPGKAIPNDKIKTLPTGFRAPYVQHGYVYEMLNETFGPLGWTYRPAAMWQGGEGWFVLTEFQAAGMTRYEIGEDKDPKSALTDGVKRAAHGLGNQFGLQLYPGASEIVNAATGEVQATTPSARRYPDTADGIAAQVQDDSRNASVQVPHLKRWLTANHPQYSWEDMLAQLGVGDFAEMLTRYGGVAQAQAEFSQLITPVADGELPF